MGLYLAMMPIPTGVYIMITRKQYMGGDYSHAEYYEQFVNESVKDRVLKYIGLDAISSSTDEHMNDIPLKHWDNVGIPSYTAQQLKDCGDNYSLAGAVCINKAAARQIKGES